MSLKTAIIKAARKAGKEVELHAAASQKKHREARSIKTARNTAYAGTYKKEYTKALIKEEVAMAKEHARQAARAKVRPQRTTKHPAPRVPAHAAPSKAPSRMVSVTGAPIPKSNFAFSVPIGSNKRRR